MSKTNILKTYDWLIKIDRPVPEFIKKLTHITDDMLEQQGVSRTKVVNYLLDNIFCREKVLLIAHNANFDLNFFYNMTIKEKRKLDWEAIDVIDTLTILKDRKPYPHKLSDAIRGYGLQNQVQNTHRAIDDAKATLYVFKKMCSENLDVIKYINILGYNPKYGISQQDMLPRVKYYEQPYNSKIRIYEHKKDNSYAKENKNRKQDIIKDAEDG